MSDTRPFFSSLLAAISALDAAALTNALKSIPPELEKDLGAEIRAAKAVVDTLEKQATLSAELAEAKEQAQNLQIQLAAEGSNLKQSERTIAASVAEHSVAHAQLETDFKAAHGQPSSSESELVAVARETRINELQAIVASLQTKLRQSEMASQQQTLELANTKASVGPTLKTMNAMERELEQAKRMLRTSDAANAQLTNQLATLQQRMSGALESGVDKVRKPTGPGPLSSPGKAPTLLQADGGVRFGGDADEQAEVVMDSSAAAELETDLSREGAMAQDGDQDLRHERARLRLLRDENAALRAECESQLERQRRGADRGLREMQSEMARLHRSNAEMRDAVQAAEGRSAGEANFRRRAEQGWLQAQRSLEKVQAELQASRIQVGEMEGRLQAANQTSTDLQGARKTINALQGKAAADEARLHELLESQKINSQHVAVAMGHAQQHAAAEYDRLQAEHSTAHQAFHAQTQWWRTRAERSGSKCSAAAAALAAARSSLESLLSRLVSATSMADLADQSRLLFEVKAALIDIEEKLRRPDSSAGGPPGEHAKKGGAKAPGRVVGGWGGGEPGSGGLPQGGSFSAPPLQLPGVGMPFATAIGNGCVGSLGAHGAPGGGFGRSAQDGPGVGAYVPPPSQWQPAQQPGAPTSRKPQPGSRIPTKATARQQAARVKG